MRRTTRSAIRKRKGASTKKRSHKYLYLLLCATCISTGWTSAKYISEIEGVVESGRTAKFSYKIQSQVYKNDTVSFDNELQDYFEVPGYPVNDYAINTKIGDSNVVKIVMTITIDSEVTTQFTLDRSIESSLPLITQTMTLDGVPGKGRISVNGIENTARRTAFSETIPPGQTTLICTASLEYRNEGRYRVKYRYATKEEKENGLKDRWENDKYMNLYPSIVQVD